LLRSAGRSARRTGRRTRRRSSPGRCRNGWRRWRPAPVHRLRSPAEHECVHGESPFRWPAPCNWRRWVSRSRNAHRDLQRLLAGLGAVYLFSFNYSEPGPTQLSVMSVQSLRVQKIFRENRVAGKGESDLFQQ